MRRTRQNAWKNVRELAVELDCYDLICAAGGDERLFAMNVYLMNNRRRLGVFKRRGLARWIELHRGMTGDELKRTFLHETAHAITSLLYNYVGHGPEWKVIMRRLGQEPNRVHTNTPLVEAMHAQARYVFKCADCSAKFYRFRLMGWMTRTDPARMAFHKVCRQRFGGLHGTLIRVDHEEVEAHPDRPIRFAAEETER